MLLRSFCFTAALLVCAPTASAERPSALTAAGASQMNPPTYPHVAACARIGGTVVLILFIDDAGNVTNAAIDKSSRNRDLDLAALAAARAWTFVPMHAGGPGPKIRVPLEFKPPSEVGKDCPGVKLSADQHAVESSDASSTTQPRWREVGTDGGSSTSIDIASLKRAGNIVQLWSLWNYDEPQSIDGPKFSSVKSKALFDCSDRTSADTNDAMYSERDGTGNVIFQSSNPIQFKPVAQGSKAEVIWKVVCAGQLPTPPARTI